MSLLWSAVASGVSLGLSRESRSMGLTRRMSARRVPRPGPTSTTRTLLGAPWASHCVTYQIARSCAQEDSPSFSLLSKKGERSKSRKKIGRGGPHLSKHLRDFGTGDEIAFFTKHGAGGVVAQGGMLQTQGHVPRDGHRTMSLFDGARYDQHEHGNGIRLRRVERGRTLMVSLRTSSSSPLSAAGAAAAGVVVASAVSSVTFLTAPTCLTLVAAVGAAAAFLGGRGGSFVFAGVAVEAALMEEPGKRADQASRVCLADRRAGWRSIAGRSRALVQDRSGGS